MRYFAKRKTSSIDYHSLLLMFLLILNGGSLLKQSRFTALSILVGLFLYSIFLLIKYRVPLKRDYIYNSIAIFLGMELLFVLQMLFLPNNIGSMQYLTMNFQILSLLTVLYFFYVKKIDFLKTLYKVLTFTMWYSLIAFILWLPFHGFIHRVGIGIYPVDTLFYVFYYPNTIDSPTADWRIVKLLGIPVFVRNQAYFWEPGVFQIYMNIFLFLSMFYYKKAKNTFFAIITILTTCSTTGYAIMFMQILFYLLMHFRKKKVFYKIPIFIGGIVLVGYALQENIYEKFEGEKQGSAIQRQIDTLSTLRIIQEYPITGIGLDSKNYFDLLREYTVFIPGKRGSSRDESGVSNSLLYLFVFFGIPLGMLFIYFYYKQNIFKKQKMLFFLIILLSSISEPIILLPFFTIFFLSGVQGKKYYTAKEAK